MIRIDPTSGERRALVADGIEDFVGWEVIAQEPFKPGVDLVVARRWICGKPPECIRVYTKVAALNKEREKP